MPFWRTSARVFAAWSRRHSLNAPAQEILTGIIPTAEVDRHWTDDRLDLWGAFTQQPGTATANRLGAVSMVPQRKEALVHRIEISIVSALARTHNFHLFTPLQVYFPTAINSNLILPWLQPVKPGQPGRLADTLFVNGETDAGLMVVTVNGLPHTAIGPSYQAASVVALGQMARIVAWDYQNPPLRVKPGQQLTVQATTQMPTGLFLNVNWYFSERVFQGDVG